MWRSSRARRLLFLLLAGVQCIVTTSSPNVLQFTQPNGIVATEDEIRRWSIELYNEQPRDPKTSMDADFKQQMEGTKSESPAQAEHTPRPPAMAPPPSPLSFLAVWSVLDHAAQASGVEDTQGAQSTQTGMAEGAVLTAIAQSALSQAPTVCLIGFNTGRAAIVWLEAQPLVRLLVFDPFEQQYQRGSRAFLQSLYQERFIPLPGQPAKAIQEVRAAQLGVQCDVVHVDGAAPEEALPALRGLIAAHHTVVITSAACPAQGPAQGPMQGAQSSRGGAECTLEHTRQQWYAQGVLEKAECQTLQGKAKLLSTAGGEARIVCVGNFLSVAPVV